MNDLCAEVGYKSLRHHGEQLCGDHVEVVEAEDGSIVIVLSDGLGSGVKASILSTLTSKIISTMLAEGLSIEECVKTIADTLPVSSEHGVAYSTFTIIHLKNNGTAELIQYDNPSILFLRDSDIWEYPKTEMMIGDKKICKSEIYLEENDIFVAMSDGCPHAGPQNTYNYEWELEDIGEFMEILASVGYPAKTLATMLVDKCDELYGGQPRDDATACVVRVRKREPMNLLFGPPQHREDTDRMLSLFFSKEGKHIICGGTTSSIAAKYLGRRLTSIVPTEPTDIPPMAHIDGVDLVTEGVVTINKVIEYAKDYLGDNQTYEHWGYKKDGASQISRLLFEEATDINFYVGKAINPAHQNPNLPINFNIKMHLVDELSGCLRRMGKRVKVSYF